MPFGFLGTLASGIGKGVGFLGKGIKSGIGKLGQMDGDGAASGGMFPQLKRPMPMTPGFNPDAAMPDIGGGKGGMFAKGIDLINRQQPQPSTMPTLRRPDAAPLEPIRDSVDINASMDGPVGGSSTLGSLLRREADRPAQVESQQTQGIGTRPIRPVRPPDFLGTPGSTLDDTPMNHSRYQYQTQYMKDGKIPRRWQDIAMNALSGAAQGFQSTGDLGGALGGAIAGGAGTAISPLHGRDFRFRNEQMPRLMEQQAETERLQDRQRKTGFEDEDRLQRKTDAEVKRREAEKRIENYDVDNRARAQEIQMRQDEMDYRRQNPPKQRRPTFRDEGGFMRYEDTGEYLLDPQTKQPIRGYDRPAAENDRPFTVSPGSALVDKTGREIYKAPPRSGAMSREAQKAMQEVNSLKQQAGSLWKQWETEADPVKKADLAKKAQMAQYMYNEAALGLAESFPDDFEAGEGEGGWNYAKPIGSTPQIQRRRQAPIVSRAAVEGFAQEKGISYDEALKRFQAKGITVQ